MIKVEKTAKTIDEGIKNMMDAAKVDYEKFSMSVDKGTLSDYSKEELDNWDKKIKLMNGKKFIKVIRENGVFAFVCKDDVPAPFTTFKKGDVLMAASWNRPALNQARGNVLTGNYPIQWTGPLYLR
jgi:hypothetical protein